MKIIFYSTNSNYFNEKTFTIKSFPSWKKVYENFEQKFSQHKLYFVTQKPGMFLCDTEDLNDIQDLGARKDSISQQDLIQNSQRENLCVLNTDSTDYLVDFIKNLRPDLVVAVSFWVRPFDWLSVKDSLIGEKLNSLGIKTICHSVKTTMTCFGKFETNNFLEKIGVPVPESVFVQHDLYFCANSKKEIRFNVYKEAVQNQINQLSLPVIAKDNVGLSSYGMQVLNTYGEISNYLQSKKNNSDRLFQEYIEGEQFGCEIHGTPGNYKILPLFKFSVNKYGITSPKQSVKFGPVSDEKYKLQQLNSDLLKIASEFKLNGIAQVDLVFNGEKWYVIEINPRLSGMTATYSVCFNTNLYEMILAATNQFEDIKIKEKTNFTLNLKFPLLPEKIILELSSSFEEIKYICQTEDKEAKQDREMGYCEVIFAAKNKKQLKEVLQKIENKYPQFIEKTFFTTALQMLDS